MTSVHEFYTAAELEQLGYVRDRLVELFGDPDPTDSEDRWSRDTVFAVERNVLAPAAQQIFTAFEPDFDTRAGMIAAGQRLGWPQMEQMLARVTMREQASADRG
ncbi:hypothetical protein RHA1_ro08405 (plasmid) [Rhodococcus jostii RHA1]|uniref:Uncharacterized protein n=3 Tax=Rhodococcus TaxID=1827 RepID=Q0RZ37_RHOJR|nr:MULTISPECIES: hypothetical protein [Rhodococcus]ABG99449.1 hypothetical protein RHA1_ro08405 [Rhodococcus jostii RHA1]EID78301.1 hypothetical protein W59_19328 [Rhodococcus opacus RKJ300 = JCM 13270]PQP20837.1 hypothetical protein C5613_27065 [Rhodococcus opacus]QQZ19105.1 hypothetical protein GO592_37200 [Rhodococcus sp. 21391]